MEFIFCFQHGNILKVGTIQNFYGKKVLVPQQKELCFTFRGWFKITSKGLQGLVLPSEIFFLFAVGMFMTFLTVTIQEHFSMNYAI